MIAAASGALAGIVLLLLAVKRGADAAPVMAARFVRWGARRIAEPGQAERYEEEWLADLERVPGKVTKLAHACGIVTVSVPRLRTQFSRRRRRPLPRVRSGRLPGRTSLPVTEGQELDSALARIGEMLVPQFADHCFIDVVLGDVFIRGMQRHAGNWTPPPGTWVQTGGQILFPAGHFCQQAMALLDTVLVTDMTRASFPAPSAPSKALSMELELTSVLAAPLYVNGTLLGVISMARSGLTSRTRPHFTTCDRDLLTTLANEVAITIRNAQRPQSLAVSLPAHRHRTRIVKLLRDDPFASRLAASFQDARLRKLRRSPVRSSTIRGPGEPAF